jgi:hypothetical protein
MRYQYHKINRHITDAATVHLAHLLTCLGCLYRDKNLSNVVLMNEEKNLDDYYGEKIYAITDESICVFSTNKLVHHLANGHFHELKIYPNDFFFCFTTLNLYTIFFFYSFFFLLFTFSFFFRLYRH